MPAENPIDAIRTADSFRGNQIVEKEPDIWVYADDGSEVSKTWTTRPCGQCGIATGKDGHDPCLGTLPGVMNACCGHGAVKGAYIQFTGGLILRNRMATALFKILSGRFKAKGLRVD